MAIQEPSGAPSALTSSALAAIRRTSAVDTVRARISLAVDLGLLAPGERLPNVQATAAALGVGEITVRRALRTLEDEGVVQRRPGRTGGTFIAERPRRRTVAQVAAYREDSERVHRLIDERIVLEAGFAHLAAERLDRPGLDRLDQCVREMDAAGSWAEFHAGDQRFHLALAEAAGLPSALAMYERVTGELYAYFLPYPLDYLRGSNEQHKAIRAALGVRDATLAAGLLRDHVAELHHSMYVGFADSDNDNTQRGDDG
ncbi:FadR/GntR family transcriptional regulator [Streptomyces malaysiensis]|uniref:FadR/GntR family transcriptional regulator n=1 Tax=Streptomyces malaysiensis TaxID=92644 RepID=UPI0033E37442